MTGRDVKRTREALGLTRESLAAITGAYAFEIEELEGGALTPLGVSPLAWDILGQLWRWVESHTQEQAEQHGAYLTTQVHTHGAGYAAWLVLSEKSLRTYRAEQAPHRED